MTIDRRNLLGLLGVGAAASGCATAVTAPGVAGQILEPTAFRHGVASGDPAQTSVLLWTRVTTDMPMIGLRWQVAEDAAFLQVAAEGAAETRSHRDHTVKVVAEGLSPGREYWYRFLDGSVVSPIGRTRTLPEAASTQTVVLAVASCSLHPSGLFNAYDAIAKMERLNAVLHLGDYIYEYGAGESDYGMGTGRRLNRIPEPAHEILSLADYRTRHAQYKADPDLQAAHARAPWIVVYDDHETANDAFDGGAQNHQDVEGDWAARKAAALKAYFEWMPIRDPEPGVGMARATQRSFRFGRSASLHMLETRLLGRTKQLEYTTDFYAPGPDGKPQPARDAFFAKLNDPSRRLLGDEQLGWLEDDVAAAVRDGCAWQLIGNQVVMARVTAPDLGSMIPGPMLAAGLAGMAPEVRERIRQTLALFSQNVPLNLDAWDGYPAERERLYQALARAQARPVVLAGDSHTFWVDQLKDAQGRKAGIEFGATGITSPSPAGSLGLPIGTINEAVATNDEVEFVDFGPRGFLALTLTPETVRADLMAVSTIETKPYRTSTVRSYQAQAQGPGVIGDLTRV